MFSIINITHHWLLIFHFKNSFVVDTFIEDFLLTHVIFMPDNHLCPTLMAQYPLIIRLNHL